MTTRQFLTYWYAGLAVAALVVGVVAALLLTIIATARGILRTAQGTLDLANAIVANTRPIWALEQTNTVAAQLLDGATAIERHATAVAEALEPRPEPRA